MILLVLKTIQTVQYAYVHMYTIMYTRTCEHKEECNSYLCTWEVDHSILLLQRRSQYNKWKYFQQG